MFASASNTGNPFLSDNDDDSYWARTTCRVPNCDQDAAKGNVACSHHLKAISPKSVGRNLGPLSPQASVQGNGTRLSPDATLSPSRKTLEAKATARKTAAKRRPFYPPDRASDRGLNHGGSAENRLRNAHASAKTSLQRPVDQPLQSLEGPARKKQRTISPTLDSHGFNHAPSASPLAPPRAFAYGKQNGDLGAIPGRLPTLTDDLRTFPSGVAKVQERPPPAVPSSYDDYIRAPLSGAISSLRTDLLRLNEEPNGIASRSSFDEGSIGDVSRNASIERTQSLRAPAVKPNAARATSTRTTPSKTKASPNEKVSVPRFPKLQPVARTPPLEQQRRRLVGERDTFELDAFIYGQQGSSQLPPPGVERRRDQREPQEQKSVLFAHMDPRTHRNRPHSDAWYRQKEEEIKARGGKKANLGKAAQRMKQQRQREDPDEFEASLPDRVRNNDNWVGALRWFHGQNGGVAQAAAPATPVRTKRPYKRRQPVAQPAPDKKDAVQDL